MPCPGGPRRTGLCVVSCMMLLERIHIQPEHACSDLFQCGSRWIPGGPRAYGAGLAMAATGPTGPTTSSLPDKDCYTAHGQSRQSSTTAIHQGRKGTATAQVRERAGRGAAIIKNTFDGVLVPSRHRVAASSGDSKNNDTKRNVLTGLMSSGDVPTLGSCVYFVDIRPIFCLFCPLLYFPSLRFQPASGSPVGPSPSPLGATSLSGF